MRELILSMTVSADGFAAGPQGEADWTFRSRTPDGRASAIERMWGCGLLIMGRTTFSAMQGYWPGSTDPFAAPMNTLPKMAFSRDRTEPPANADGSWAQPFVSGGPLAAAIARLKAEPGKPILAIGGVGFARSLIAEGVVDEFRLIVHPVVIGQGLSIFADLPAPLRLKTVDCRVFSAGIIAQTYRPE